MLNSAERLRTMSNMAGEKLATDIYGGLHETAEDAVKGVEDVAKGAAGLAQDCANDTGDPEC